MRKLTDNDWITTTVERGIWHISQIIDDQVVAIKIDANPKPTYKIFKLSECKLYERLDFEEEEESEALQGKVNAWVNKFIGANN